MAQLAEIVPLKKKRGCPKGTKHEDAKTHCLDVDWLRSQLLKEGGSCTSAGAVWEVSRQRIHQIAKASGLTNIRKKKTAEWHAMYHGVPELANKNWLLAQKAKGNIGIKNLAGQLNISPVILIHQMERLGLKAEEFYFYHTTQVVMHCGWCGKKLIRTESYLSKKNYRRAFCDRKHFYFWWRKQAQKTHGWRRQRTTH